MIRALQVVDSVKTPIGLAALGLLVLFYLYRLILSRLRIERVASKEVALLVSKAMSLLFWIAIMGIVTAVASYVLLKLFDPTEVRLNDSVAKLQPGGEATLSAIADLTRLAARTEEFDETICGALAAFVRDAPKQPAATMFLEDLSSDLQSALSLLSQLNESQRCKQLSLRGANLTRADLPDGHFAGVELTGAKLDEANLRKADLSRSNLTGASLVGANLQNIRAVSANFIAADLRDADFRCANLDDAQGLEGADLGSERFDGASLRGVNVPNPRRSRGRAPIDCQAL
jgi:hypothetical protein